VRYLGGKSLLAPAIYELTQQVAPRADAVTDLFTGSGALSDYFKRRGFQVTTNDLLYFSYAISRGSLALNKAPTFDLLRLHLGEDPRHYLGACPLPDPDASQFLRLNYSPDSTPARQYLTRDNALRIDRARQQIEAWRTGCLLDDDEYFHLLAGVVAGVPSVSNITGTYGSYLKYWDKRALNDFRIPELEVFDNGRDNQSYNLDAITLLGRVSGQVLYLDPPYNERQYLPNYHVLETVARYDSPAVRGVTGQRPVGSGKSDFCSRKTALAALEDVISTAQFEHIILSYNNEGVISTNDLRDMLARYAAPGSFRLTTVPYRRYKNKIPNHAPGLAEQLYYIRKTGVA
jgi:adenine-specific DNA-methyltransferase